MAEKIDVSHSLMNARWVLPKIDMDITERISRKYGLSEFISQLMVNRDIEEESIDSFLNPTLSKDFPDPFLLKDMDQLSVYLADAIANEKKIAVFGDFDVDGACSTALFVRFFRHLGLDVPYY